MGEQAEVVRAYHQAAHHDIWWAKGQMWNVTAWTIAWLAFLAGAGRLMGGEPLLFSTLTAGLFVFSVSYILRLQDDVVRARKRIACLRQLHASLDAIGAQLPGSEGDDADRGWGFVLALGTLLAVAVTLCWHLFNLSPFLA